MSSKWWNMTQLVLANFQEQILQKAWSRWRLGTKVRIEATVPSWVSLVHSPLCVQVLGTCHVWVSWVLVTFLNGFLFQFVFCCPWVVFSIVPFVSLSTYSNVFLCFYTDWSLQNILGTHRRRVQESQEVHFLSERKLHQSLIRFILSALTTHKHNIRLKVLLNLSFVAQ